MTNILEGNFFSQFSVSCLNYNTKFWGGCNEPLLGVFARSCMHVCTHACVSMHTEIRG